MPLKLDKVPPDTITSEATKFVDDSLKVNVNVAVSPAIRLALFVLNVITGATVSTSMVSVLLESDPSAFKLPAKSVVDADRKLTA